MGKAVVRGGFDTWAGAGAPSMEHPRSPWLRLDSGSQESFIYFKNPVPRGATVTKATLTFYARGNSSGARTLSVRRVAESWKVGRLNWNNRPTTTGTTVTTSVNSLPEGTRIEFNVTAHMQLIADGSKNFGWKVTTDSTATHYLFGLNAAKYKPTLTVEWSDKPDKPTRLNPTEGAVATPLPTLTFDYTDVSGNTELASVQVHISATKDGTTPDFDSGEVASAEPELDLSQTAYPGVSSATFWRVRVKDGAGLWSDWSDWAPLSYLAKTAVVITNPADIASPYVTEPTPPIAWTFAGTQTAWQVRITDAADRSKVLYDTGKQKGTATEHTLPAGVLKDDRSYSVNVRVWDNNDREAVPDSPIFSYAWRDFFMDDDVNTPGAQTLTATVVPDAPWVDLVWTRDTMPDSFAVYRNNKVIEVLDPTEVLDTGTTYKWRDNTAAPQRVNTYAIKAVVNGKQSPAGVTRSVTPSPVGIWLIDLDRGVTVVLAGDDEGTWEMPDDAATYVPIGSEETVRIVAGLRGYEGSLGGLLIDGMAGKTFEAQEDDLWSIKERPSQTVRLIAGDVNIRVLIGNLDVAPHPVTRRGDIVKKVSFDFWQVGGLPFEPRL